MDQKSEETQVATLIYSMGEEADEIFNSFTMTSDDRKKYDAVKAKFEGHFIIKRNVIFERAKFNLRVQKQNEPVDTFITDLFTLAQHCNYGNLHDEMVRDRIVVGLKDKSLSEKLQLEAELTLENAINQARQRELVRQQQGIIRQEGLNASTVDKIKSFRHKPAYKHTKPTQNTNVKSQSQKCGRCGGSLHKRKECPATQSICNRCKRKGHWEKCCKTKSVAEIQRSEDSQEFFTGEIHIDKLESDTQSPWKADIEVNGQVINFKLDSGADVSVLPARVYQTLDVKLEPTNKVLLGPCNYKLDCLGKFKATLAVNQKCIDNEIYVVKGLEKPLLSRQASQSLNLINKIDALSCQEYKSNIVNQYPDLFKGLGEIPGEYEIKLIENPNTFALTTPRKVPLPLLSKTKLEIERMLEMGVIKKIDEPTDWCAPMVVVPKPSGEVRICVDLTKLNANIKREVHPLPSVEYTLGKVGSSRVFTKLDANSAFWQRKLSNKSKLLTTFITPWGRYCFERLPYGISTGSEQFQKVMESKLEGLEGVECQIDDILVHGKSQQIHDERLQAVLKRLADSNITLNLEKCEFSKSEVRVLGNIISGNGISPDPSKIAAIVNLPAPKNIKEVRSFLGMVNQLSKFTNHLADKTKPLRDLLSKKNSWTWSHVHDNAFRKIKECLTTPPVLAFYDVNRKTKVCSDASKYGIGGVILQEQDNGLWKPIAYFSRALTETELRYSPIEKECLAFTWLCERASDYILGKAIIGVTDHKPLLPMLTTHCLDQLPPRIQRFRMRLMRFNIQSILHVPGKEMYTPDTLSRLMTNNTVCKEAAQFNEETEAYVCSILNSLPVSDVILQKIIEAQDTVEVCRTIKEYCFESWPEKHLIPSAIRPYWMERANLTVVQNVLLKGSRIVIPSAMRLDVLDRLHEAHMGINKCRERAKQAVWWPGLSKQIQDMVENCKVCLKHKVNRPEPLSPTPFPERPWQELGMDFFQCQSLDYLIVLDYYSRFIEIAAMNKNKRGSEVVRCLKSMFSRHGIPEKVRSDNGPPFDSAEYAKFANDWGFMISTSSPKFPKSNGEAERAVQTAKSILKKGQDQAKALLAYRATPLACGYSPAQLLMGRNIRSTVPTFHAQLKPQLPDMEVLRKRENDSRLQQQANFNKRHRAAPLSTLSPGTKVHITSYDQPGTVVNKADAPRSYIIETPNKDIRRNREHLIPLEPVPKSTKASNVVKDPPELNIKSRPKRTIQPSLKALENMAST